MDKYSEKPAHISSLDQTNSQIQDETGANEKQNHARFMIQRFDHYYDSVNNKGAFYIGLNTFIFGGLCVGYLNLCDKITPSYGFWALFCGIALFNALSIFLTVSAIMPFLTDNRNDNKTPSLIFFGGIAKHELSYFKEKFHNAETQTVLDDLVEQVHCLATGLSSKYKNLKNASHFIVAQFFLMFPLFYLIIKNLKP